MIAEVFSDRDREGGSGIEFSSAGGAGDGSGCVDSGFQAESVGGNFFDRTADFA